jgi:sister chromatid cohesion protein DCC1
MAPSFNVSFGADAQQEGTSTYRLIELSPDLVKAFEEGSLKPGSLQIKGRGTDDAVFTTPDSTYAIRSVSISNTIIILTSPPGHSDLSISASDVAAGADEVHNLLIRDQLHEILELVPAVPRLERLEALLRSANSEADGEGSSELIENSDVCP